MRDAHVTVIEWHRLALCNTNTPFIYTFCRITLTSSWSTYGRQESVNWRQWRSCWLTACLLLQQLSGLRIRHWIVSVPAKRLCNDIISVVDNWTIRYTCSSSGSNKRNSMVYSRLQLELATQPTPVCSWRECCHTWTWRWELDSWHWLSWRWLWIDTGIQSASINNVRIKVHNT